MHTDVALCGDENGVRVYATFGMCARAMTAPTTEWERIELVMVTTPNATTEQQMTVAAELQHLSKFPFREKTWFGNGHTINVSKEFHERFGFDAVVFVETPHVCDVPEIGDVRYLLCIPVYQSELDWMMEHSSLFYVDTFSKHCTENFAAADIRRAEYLPNEQEEEAALAEQLGISVALLQELAEYLTELEERGVEVNYPIVRDWIDAQTADLEE